MNNKPNLEILASGTKIWCLNNKYHREDGPAIEFVNGTKMWRLKGKRHRKDGPACEYPDGEKEWFLDDKWYRLEEDYWKELFNRGLITEKELFLKLL
jgi:hypothetical protein